MQVTCLVLVADVTSETKDSYDNMFSHRKDIMSTRKRKFYISISQKTKHIAVTITVD